MALDELEKRPKDSFYFIPGLLDDVFLPNLTVGTINLQDYQAVKLYTDEGLNKLIEHLKARINIFEKTIDFKELFITIERQAIAIDNLKKSINDLINRNQKPK
ncbi:MAG: hypothetical protein IPN97_16290 [Saprospiraceae bacterium]|nr:hypothetical protein [Saprospiraceae bacterium]